MPTARPGVAATCSSASWTVASSSSDASAGATTTPSFGCQPPSQGSAAAVRGPAHSRDRDSILRLFIDAFLRDPPTTLDFRCLTRVRTPAAPSPGSPISTTETCDQARGFSALGAGSSERPSSDSSPVVNPGT